ncbi:glycosyl hydrolase 2 galactose-binding domain-containing protein [Actinocrispum wychmicini]|uniref:Exo-1,4-beta-D-glucosaminidase n=1 Tax=Actinocrispum wychmicini TaxID=1213861 RepID=A0A4R2J4K2_9PSEU|nr:beta-mannosidase [Actinocrispum wychmicini]TCO53114.1 exo-1,4-beta-D-glucosaminidase [Actinocrispum wychmicini]
MSPSRRYLAFFTAVVTGAALLAGSAGAAEEDFGGGRSGDLVHGWRIQSSAVATDSGAVVSQPGYPTAGWLPISQPETLMAGLLENGRFPDIFQSNNLSKVPADQFKVNWWYRDDLWLRPRPGQHQFLVMNGVLGRANLWVNGTKVADQAQLQGAYSRLEYDITPLLKDGSNAIALDVFRNDTTEKSGQLSVDMVDWNPKAPDNWTGLQFAPQLRQDGAVSVRNAHVLQNNASDLSSSELTVKADVRNNTGTPQTVDVNGTITRQGTFIDVHQRVTVPANATKTVSLAPTKLRHPAVWWPYQMGDQPMYHLDVRAAGDQQSEDFAIRTVTSTLTPVTPGQTHGQSGYRQYSINGVPFVVRGGGWSQDMFLRYSAQNIHDQLSYIKNMGLNSIRFEGNLPPDDMFRQMDRMGVLAMPGWQCCNKWEQPSSRWSDDIKASAANQARNVAQWLRDHPSVFTFYQGSDNEPDPAKEAIFLAEFKAANWSTPQVSSAEYKSSAQLGPSGAKEGPYNYAPPNYWWNNGPVMNEGGDFTNAGGAFGYDTESSPGNTIPTVDSLNRFLTPADQNQIWDVTSTNGKGTGPNIFHTSGYNDYTAIARLGRYNTPLWNRYGHWTDMASYQRIAQAGGYEVTRAQFEAYLGHAKDPVNPSTGLIYWQMNKAWPSLQWELYGYDLDQPGVFFGAKQANEPVHIMYAYDDGSIKVTNLTNQRQSDLRASVQFVDVNGTVRGSQQVAVPTLSTQDVQTVLRPAVPAGISSTYFLKLTLSQGGHEVSRNVYWLSTKADQVDYARTIGEGSGAEFVPGGYADLTGLQSLAPARIQTAAHTQRDGDDLVTTVTVRNVSDRPTVGFMLRADVRRGANGRPLPGDNQVLPILWSQNDLTLWPGESQTITARYHGSALKGARPVVTLSGWNVGQQALSGD